MVPQNIPAVPVQRVLIIDDQILFREGLIGLLESTPDFEVVGDSGSVHDGIEMAKLHKPDIILMDFSLPDGSGLDATSAILKYLPNCKIVFLTVYENDESLFAALRLGAMGYMLKNITTSDLLASLRALERDEKAVSRKMMSAVMDEFTRLSPPSSLATPAEILLTRLTPREKDVLRELSNDPSNLEIAQRLFLSENTVKHYIRNILDKIEVENRRAAVQFSRQNLLRE